MCSENTFKLNINIINYIHYKSTSFKTDFNLPTKINKRLIFYIQTVSHYIIRIEQKKNTLTVILS